MTATFLLLLACAPTKLDLDSGGDGGATSPDGGADGGADGGTDGGTDGGSEPPPPPALGEVQGPLALDPLRGAGGVWRIQVQDASGAERLEAELLDAAGASVALLVEGLEPDGSGLAELDWAGAIDGDPVEPGRYSLELRLLGADGAELDAASNPLFIVRTGILGGTWGGSGEATEQRVALLWHRASGASSTWHDGADEPAFQLDAITTGTGSDEQATEVPDIWSSLRTPPSGWTDVNLPQGFSFDSLPSVELEVQLEPAAALALDWQPSIEGYERVDGGLEEGRLRFRKVDPVASGLGVSEGELSLVWSLEGVPVATQAIPYRHYALMGPATFTSSSSPYMAWVEAVDGALRAMPEGVTTDEEALDALIEWIFLELGLRYDTRSGASYYMSYSGWSSGQFNFKGFLDRSSGSTINCSDCSGIAGVYANMLGVPLDYSIILSNFQLNQIEAIGVGSFTNCPFGAGGCGFSYHAVTTNDNASSIWDATLALDGDSDPGSSPSTRLFVQDIDGDEYLTRLVKSGRASYNYSTTRVTLR